MWLIDRFKAKDKVVDVDLKNLEVESNNRLGNLPRWNKVVAGTLAVMWTLFQLYTGFFGLFPGIIQRSTTLAFAMALCFICFRMKKSDSDRVPIYDWIFVAISFGIMLYLFFSFETLVLRGGAPNQTDVIVGLILIALLIEATRRCVGMPLVVVALVFLVYAVIGPHLPVIIGHRGYDVTRISSQMFLTAEGIFGVPMGVMTTFVFAFIVFGTFLEVTGGATLFINLAFSLTGRYAGGPAKTAVVASGLLGTISGSSLANVVTTGSFTIPLMKKCGYKPSFAGGVEASASSAGQIMPPVMGAAAFIMAEMTGIPYLKIALAALIPAILYYLSIFLSVDLEARRTNLKTIPADQIPKLWPTLKKCLPLILPIATLVTYLVIGYSPLKSALYSTLVMIGASFFGKETRLNGKKFLEAFQKSAYNAVSVAVACGVCGIMIGVITLTGLGLKLSDLILTASGGLVLPTLLLTMVASIILGMGLPTTAKYIILASIAAPALVKLGIPLISAHLFILYFGVIAEVTPPVALTSYAGAAVARAPGMETAMQGLKISIGAFFIPFKFIYYSPLVLENVTVLGMASGLFSAFIGVICLSAGSIGYFFGDLKLWQRLILFAVVGLVLVTSLITDVIGFGIIVLMVIYQKKMKARSMVTV